MLPLNINGKPYMGSPMTPSHLTYNDLERQSQGHQDFFRLISHKEALTLGHVLTIKHK